MSIRPVSFSADGSISVWHDEAGHGGNIAFSDVRFGRSIDGTVNLRFIELSCPFPGCGSGSIHPIGGGAAPAMVQKLFLRVLLRRLPAAQRNLPAVKAFMRTHIEATDGLGRFKLEDITSEDDDVDVAIAVETNEEPKVVPDEPK